MLPIDLNKSGSTNFILKDENNLSLPNSSFVQKELNIKNVFNNMMNEMEKYYHERTLQDQDKEIAKYQKIQNYRIIRYISKYNNFSQ